MNNSIRLYTILQGRGICKFVFTLLCCLMIAMQSYGQDVEAYAVYTEDANRDATLTFYYDDQRSSHTTTFDLNTGNHSPEWTNVSSPYRYFDYIKKVVFDKSFKNAKPTSCYGWFQYTPVEDIIGLEFLNTSNVTNMACMFQVCHSLPELDFSHFDTHNVTNMEWMFSECFWTSFPEVYTINLSSFNTENVKNMECMFFNCPSIRTIKVSSKWNTDNVEQSSDMFDECVNLEGQNNTFCYDIKIYDKTYARIDKEGEKGYLTGCEPYAILSADGTLTLKFDENRPEKSYDIGYYYWQNDVDKITKVVFDPSFAYYRPTSCQRWFANLENLEKIEGINEYLNTSQVTSMGGMFYQCYKLSGELNLSNFDTQNVTDMSEMFLRCENLQTIDISNFNTSSVTHMGSMFMECKNLTKIITGDGWTTKVVEYMYQIFCGCEKYNSADFVSKFETQNVVDMGDMFNNNMALTKLDLSNFDTQKVKNMHIMFGGCENLETIIIDTEKFSTTNVSDMSGMFMHCKKLAYIDLSKFDTEKVESMYGMFYGCDGFSVLDLSNFNTHIVEDIRGMFAYCDNLTTIIVGSDWDNSKFQDERNDGAENTPPFYKAVNLIGNTGISYTEDKKSSEYARIDNGYLTTDSYKIFYDLGEDGEWTGTEPQSSFDIDLKQDITITTKPTKKGYTFKGWYGTPITGLTEKNPQKNITIKAGDVGNRIYTAVWEKDAEPYAVLDNGTLTLYYNDSKPTTDNVYNPPSFDDEGNEIYDSRSWNWIASEVKTVDFDASFADYAPTNCTKWFANMINLTELKNTENFNTSQVESMEYMFGECESLTNLDLTFLNTDNVTNMRVMFLGCTNLKELNLSSFNTSQVQNMESMFSLCRNLTTIYVDEWKLTDGLLSTNMFAWCDKLHGGECTTLIGNKLDAEYARIDGVDGKLGYFTKIGEAPCTNDKAPYGVLDDGTLTLVYTGIKPINGQVFDITETFAEGVYDGNVGWSSDDAKSVNKVVFDQSFEYYYPKSCHNWFANMENLTTIENIEYLNTDSVRNMQGLFMFCPFEVLDLSSFNTKYVKNMSGMFAWCPNLKTIFVGDDWSTESVTLGNGLFLNCSPNLRGGQCTSYKDDKIDVAYARIDGGESAPGYFTKIGEPVCDKNLLEAYGVFSDGTLTFFYDENKPENAYPFGNVSEKSSEITKVVFDESFADYRPTDLRYLFYGYENLTEIVDMEKYLYTEDVTDIRWMFYNCSNLTILEVSNFNTGKVTDMGWMFYGCSSLTSIDVSHFNTEKVTNMFAMFSGCSSLTTLDVSHFNTGNVTDMCGMFHGCLNLTTLDVSNFNTKNVTRMSFMFYGCSGLSTLDVSHFNTGKVTDMSFMFSKCENINILDVSYFNTENVMDMSYMFSICSSLTSLDVSNFNTKNVKVMHSMFGSCLSISTLDVSNFTTVKVTDMSYMFENCTSLTDLTISNFDTEKVTDMHGMFLGCSGLTILDVSNFVTKNVTDMGELFLNCHNLTTILVDRDKWSTQSIPSSYEIPFTPFYSSENLIGNAGTQYNASHTDIDYAHIDEGESNPGYLTTESYKVIYDLDGGNWNGIEPPTSFALDLNESIKIPEPKKKGYKFLGWTGTLASGISSENPTTNVSITPDKLGNRIYTAHWEEDFNNNDKPALNLPQTLSFPAIPQQPESFCQGNEKSAILKFTPTGITVTDYELSIADIITSDAHPAMDMTINGKDTTYTIKIDIPENQTPGVYHGTIKLFAKDNPTPYEESVTVEVAAAKDIVLYLYEDVIFVDNCKELYQKDQWQWYKNGSPIKNANRQFYFERPLNGSYMAEMKSVKDGLTVYSCPVVATIDLSKNATQPVKSYPNPAVSGQPVSLYIVNYNADHDYTISLSNSNGVIVNTIPHAPETSVITLPRGIYSGALISGGSKKGFKLIVR